MLINGVEFAEYTTEDRRSPEDKKARDSQDRVRHLRQLGPCGPLEREGGAAAILGFAEKVTETVGGNSRTYVRRTLPHCMDPSVLAQDWNDLSLPAGLWASSIESCAPYTGHVRPTNEGFGVNDSTPVARDGLAYRVNYASFPYFHRYPQRATAGPLAPNATDFGAGDLGRHDEGDALRRGWMTYSAFVSKRVEDATKTVTVPNGMVKYSEMEGQRSMACMTGWPYTLTRSRFRYRHIQVPVSAIPFLAIAACRGGVNRDQFDNIPPFCGLFDGFSFNVYCGGVGNRWYADLEFSVIVQYGTDRDAAGNITNRGWLGWPRVIDGAMRFWPISPDGLGLNTVYPLVDLADLFRPDQESTLVP
jgi:hypothetical protein